GERASVASHAACGVVDAQALPVDGNARAEIGRTSDGERALREGEGAFRHLEGADRLRDEEVEIDVSLAVYVRPFVDGDAVHGHLEIGAVAGVESAQEELAPLALAAVLDEFEAWNCAQQVLRVATGKEVELVGREVARGGGGARSGFAHDLRFVSQRASAFRRGDRCELESSEDATGASGRGARGPHGSGGGRRRTAASGARL